MNDIVDELEAWRDYEYCESEMPYEALTRAMCEIRDTRDEIERLRSVLNAVRAECDRILDIMGANAYDMGCRNTSRNILRALDGEPCPTCDAEPASIAPCPTCGGSGRKG